MFKGIIWDFGDLSRPLPGCQEDGQADEEGKDESKEGRDDDWGEGKMDWLGRGGGQESVASMCFQFRILVFTIDMLVNIGKLVNTQKSFR